MSDFEDLLWLQEFIKIADAITVSNCIIFIINFNSINWENYWACEFSRCPIVKGGLFDLWINQVTGIVRASCDVCFTRGIFISEITSRPTVRVYTATDVGVGLITR